MRTLPESSLTIQVAELKSVLPILSRIIRGRVSVPILGMVKVERDPAKQALSLTATDLDLSVRVMLPCLFECEEQEGFLVQMEDLQRVVKTASHPQAGIELRALRADEEVRNFPEDPQLRQAATTKLNAREVESLFDAFTCVSEDQTRYVICGVYVDPGDGGRMVATDGRHLVCLQAPALAALPRPFILPDHRLWSWRGFRDSGGCNLRLGTFGSDHDESPGFQLEGEGWIVTGKGVQGCYPNYRQVIPAASQFVSRVDLGLEGVAALAQKLEQLARWKNTPEAVGLRIASKQLHLLHREKADQAFLETSIPVERIRGLELTVMANREYLIKAPRFGFTCMELIDPCSPVKFSGENGLLIVMPLRLEGPAPTRTAEKEDGEQSPASTEPAESTQPDPASAGEPEQAKPKPQLEHQHQTQPEHQLATNMKPSNGNHHPASNGNVNGNGHNNGKSRHLNTSNGHRLPQGPALDGEEASAETEADPMDAAVQQLASVRETLRGALTSLGELSATLKAVRQQQRDTEREIRSVRSTIRSLKDIRL